MRKNFILTQDDFENLLRWLSPDREVAGEMYEKVRNGLIRFFTFRGCSDPEALTDETINRVATKVSTFTDEGQIKTITYFYGFAANIYREYLSKRSTKVMPLDENLHFNLKVPTENNEPEDTRMDCLEQCLDQLSIEDRGLIMQYYVKEKKEKIELRNELAKKMGLTPGALYLKVHRIRVGLKGCVENCQKNDDNV